LSSGPANLAKPRLIAAIRFNVPIVRDKGRKYMNGLAGRALLFQCHRRYASIVHQRLAEPEMRALRPSASRLFLFAKNHGRHFLRWCAFALLFPCLVSPAQSTGKAGTLALARYTHQVWNTSSGLPQDTVRQFLQTRDGYLWMATDGGLVRFDGTDFTIFDRHNTPQMQSDLVNGLLEDQAGNLWIGTSNGLVEYSARGESPFTRFAMQQGLPSDSVSSLFRNAAGQICAETAAGNACQTSMGFAVLPDGSRVDPSSEQPKVTSSDGAIWSASSAGLRRIKDGETTEVAMPDGFAGSDILTLFVDREGDLWVGSENAGAAILRQPPFASIGKKDGLAADHVRSLLQDADGDLWFGTSAGLTRLHQGVYSTIAVAQGLASNEIIALASSHPGGPQDTGGNDSGLWIGTPDGLSHLEHGRISTLTASDGLPDDDIRSLLESRDHSLWIGTTHGLAHLTPGKIDKIQTVSTADGLPSNVIGSLLEDADGSLWIGTRAGLAHLQNGQIHRYTEGLASTIITALGTDSSGTLWIGTSGGGLYELKTERLLRAQTPAGDDFPETIYSVLEDGQGQVWMSSSNGIYRIADAQLHALAENPGTATAPLIIRYDVSDGLRINDCSSGGHPEAIRATGSSGGGQLLFATDKGVSVVGPADLALRPPPPVALESVLIDDTAAGKNDVASRYIPAGHERLAFHYAGLSFAAPSKVRYRYRLEHFDRTWIDAGTRRTAYYTNIPPGRYRFRVLASTDGVTWSVSAAEIGLVIAPHYYQTWWFYTLLALLVALIGWQLYLYRVRQVELRFNAVLGERGRIAREIHDTLAQDIVAISVQLDLVARLMTLSVDKAREQLIATRDLVRKSLAEARSSIWDLRSQSSASGDLPARMREVTRQVVGDSPLKLNMEITGSYRPVPREIEDELLRIAQEAVTNAVRHGDPQTIDVSLSYHSSGVDLRVHDDGRGFTVSGESSGPPGHYGIRGMYERAEKSGAKLTVESTPGAGTTVLAKARIH
jgi:signal transduction histidine kinase/ligand-binding sensor domain-containing protein